MALMVRDCYRLLELSPGASVADIKRAYRRLARRYHPDSGHRSASADKFAAVSQAYQMLLERAGRSTSVSSTMPRRSPPPAPTPPPTDRTPAPPRSPQATTPKATTPHTTTPPRSPQAAAPPPHREPTAAPAPEPPRQPRRSPQPPRVQINPHLSKFEQELKEQAYQRLQGLFQAQRFPSAIALAEGLAQRLDQDQEVRQWLAIAYHRWGRELVDRNQGDRAEIFLKKALNTDPRNRQLWVMVDHELQRLSWRSS
ncbi:MAG: molecular chaperone DnaJ [Oscillatoriales cyanobacterium]|nr:MAG: molecular chaperone DnaJ [Oscillatoriales cyanobacterium]